MMELSSDSHDLRGGLLRGVLTVVIVSSQLISGCKSGDYVQVTNATQTPVLIQLALPWPAYVPFGSLEHFEFNLVPAESWNTRDASAGDVASFETRVNGVTVLRLWTKHPNEEWRVFSGDTSDWADLTIRSLENGGGFSITGVLFDGTPVLMEDTSFDWFYENEE